MKSDDPLLLTGCSCHLSPPCNLCVGLDEDEANAYANGGMRGLIEFIEARDGEVEYETMVPAFSRRDVYVTPGLSLEDQSALVNAIAFPRRTRLQAKRIVRLDCGCVLYADGTKHMWTPHVH